MYLHRLVTYEKEVPKQDIDEQEVKPAEEIKPEIMIAPKAEKPTDVIDDAEIQPIVTQTEKDSELERASTDKANATQRIYNVFVYTGNKWGAGKIPYFLWGSLYLMN